MSSDRRLPILNSSVQWSSTLQEKAYRKVSDPNMDDCSGSSTVEDTALSPPVQGSQQLSDDTAGRSNANKPSMFVDQRIINVTNVTNNGRTESTQETAQDRQPSNIILIRRPPVGMIETNKFRDIYDKVKQERVLILQCRGVPGSGKSQIIRRLGVKFPSDPSNDGEPIIKWHIQCKDSGHDVKEELKTLSEKLLKQNHKNMTQEKNQSITDNLEIAEAKLLSETLIETDVPTLIIIEDPPPNSRSLLNSLYHNLASNSKSAKRKVHLYITSRTPMINMQCISSDSFKSCFQDEKIKGFDQEEAVKYLNEGRSEEKKEEAIEIFKRFSGLPFCLQAVKGYCANIEYSEYLTLVDEVDWDIMDDERKQTIKEYGEYTEHVFQAIVMPFIPDNEFDTSGILQWKILSCVSYFNYDRIPRQALEYCCHMLRGKPVKNSQIRNKVDIGKLVSKLLQHGMCSITDEKEITFDEVIMKSFRLNKRPRSVQLDTTEFDPLKKAIYIMCGLVSKDMREKHHATQMQKLRRHLQSLLEHIDKDEDIFEDKEDSLLLKALTSHLHETAAAIMLHESPLYREESRKNFKQALELLWEERIDYTIPQSYITPDEIAQIIVEESKMKSKDLPENFAVLFASKLEYCMDEKEKIFLRSKSKKSKGKNPFKRVESNLNTQESKEKMVELLQDCEVFLSNEQHKAVFYAERFASILHSWSRLILYAEPRVVETNEKCMWRSSLCRSICVECRKSCNVPLLIERLSMTGGWFPILLKQKKYFDHMVKALKTCKSLLEHKKEEDEPMYENGLLKEVYGPSYTGHRVALLRNIVRISSKLIGRRHKVDQDDADKYCQELLELAQDNAETKSNCIMCIIYCAKYYAVKGEVKSSLDCFVKYFKLEPVCKPRFNVRCWAIYNYARAVLSFSVREKQDEVIKACNVVLNTPDVMDQSLKECLQDCLKNLKKSQLTLKLASDRNRNSSSKPTLCL